MSKHHETLTIDGVPLKTANVSLISLFAFDRYWLLPFGSTDQKKPRYDLISVESAADSSCRATLHEHLKSMGLRATIDQGYLGTARAVAPYQNSPDGTVYRDSRRMFFSSSNRILNETALQSSGLVPLTLGRISSLMTASYEDRTLKEQLLNMTEVDKIKIGLSRFLLPRLGLPVMLQC